MMSPITDSRFDFRPQLVAAPRWAKIALFMLAGAVHLLANLLYASAHGPRSSPDGDLWFFVGVAEGVERLFPTDPLQIFLPILGFLGASGLYVLLVLLSNALHLATLWLLFRALVAFFHDEWAAWWGCAFFTLSAVGGLASSTGAMTHSQEALPVLVGLLWAGHEFMMARTEREKLRAAGTIVALLLLGVLIGPDVFVLGALAGPSLMIWYFRRFMDPFIRHVMGTLLLTLYFAMIVMATPYLITAITYGAEWLRGLHLESARGLGLGGFAAMSWLEVLSVYGPLYAVFALLAVWAWSSGRLSELALIATGVIFATVARRFFPIAELGFAALICWALARPLRLSIISKHTVGAVLLAVTATHACWKGVPCAVPGAFAEILEEVARDPRPDKLVLCTPSYGSLVRAVAGARPTSDLREVHPEWVRLAMMPAEEAVPILAERKVTHLFLTSTDFDLGKKADAHGIVESAFVGSGGFEALLNDLPKDKVMTSLAYQALFGKTPISGLVLLQAVTHPATEQRAVLYRIGAPLPP